MRSAVPKKTDRARALRRASTDAEAKLWRHLRNRQLAGCKFVRQEPIGRYFADFVCREKRLIIEVDGSQHADNVGDHHRNAVLHARGYRVIRVCEVLENIQGVSEMLLTELRSGAPPHPALSPPAGRG